MIEEIEASIINDLHYNKPCIPSYYVQHFPRIQANDLLRIFIGIFKRDAGTKYDLLCHLIIFSNNKMHVQNQRYSNIQKGVIACSNGQSIQFNKNQIKQLKILAIFPTAMASSTVQETIDGVLNTKKSKEYQNKCTILPKLIVQNKMINNNKSKNKREEKSKQEVKTEIHEQKKNVKRTNSKSSIEMQPTKPQGLKKVSSKDQTPQPILTSYQAERKKVQEVIAEKKPKPSLKMQLDSDEDYYNPQKPEELQRLISNKQVETDMSGKKDKQQIMEIEVQRQKSEKPKDNFIVNDDEDDDEDDIYNKMEEIAKKPSLCQTQQSSQSPKTEIHKPIQKKQPPKKALTDKQIPSNKPVVQTKPVPSLMNWLKPKQML